ARGGRHHRLLHPGRAGGRVAGDDRQLRQGSDAADDRSLGRHARHDEQPHARPRLRGREVRRWPGEAGRRAGADGGQRRQRPRCPGCRPQDRREADRRAWRSGSGARRRAGHEEGQAARQSDRPCRQCPAVEGAGDAEMRRAAAAATRRTGAAGDSRCAAARLPGASR
ncbi:hypothetical protein LTR94_032778, partial [Friedmanniomyces endolithicus]